jgi:hypothetical protein
VDTQLGGGYAIASQVGIRALMTYTRICSSAHPDLGAPYVAGGGAIDQSFVSIWACPPFSEAP